MNKTAACTVMAKNYLALARSLAASLRETNPGVDFFVLVLDEAGFPFSDVQGDPLTVLLVSSVMAMDQYTDMARRYDITELSTSVKPFLLRALLDRGYDDVLYMDPDIQVFQPLSSVWKSLESHPIVLTPHLLEPLEEDGQIPDERSILQAGAYNLGFVGVRRSETVRRFLDWWAARLEKYCQISISEGLFVDQKWVDLVPGLFDGVGILRDPACNVAYWNLPTRPVSRVKGVFYAAGKPLVFYHFSGYDTDRPDRLSKHDTRHRLSAGGDLAALVGGYRERLLSYGHERYKRLPYEPLRGFLRGVNVAGYLTAELGVGEAGRAYVRALQALSIPTTRYDFSTGTPSRKTDDTFASFTSKNIYSVNVICVNADQLPRFARHMGASYFSGKYNIGCWWWELPEFPEEWRGSFRFLDEIWVGSEFIRQSLQPVSPLPVRVMPPVVDIRLPRAYAKPDFGLSEGEYVFTFVFDFYSFFERKNPLAVVAAFRRAFRPEEPVRLVIKCNNGAADPGNFNRLKKEIEGARITLIPDYLSRDDKNGLLQVSDAYVSLHRSEGFGFPIAEAMFLGKPVIATAWSGSADLMHPDHSFPVPSRRVTLDRNYGPYRAGQSWADPDVERAAAFLRHVVDHPEDGRAVGERARRFIRQRYSPEAVGNALVARLEEIERERGVLPKAWPGRRRGSRWNPLLPLKAGGRRVVNASLSRGRRAWRRLKNESLRTAVQKIRRRVTNRFHGFSR